MKARHHLPTLTQSDLSWAGRHWSEYDAVIVVCDAYVTATILHRPVQHENVPTEEDITTWVDCGVGVLSQGKRLLVVCDDGDHRSATVSALIQAIHENRPFLNVVDQYHNEFLLENPPHNWWPYTKWRDAIVQYLSQHYPHLAEQTTEEKPPLAGRFPQTLIDYQFTDFNRLLMDMLQDGRWGRADQLASLYAYVLSLPAPALVVEIGTYQGASAIVMAHALKARGGGHLITIDPAFRQGGAEVIDADDQPPKTHALDLHGLLDTISAQKLDGYISIVPDYSENALKRWDGKEIDLLYVDGAHTFSAVKVDCGWLKYVKPGGLAAFDDWLSCVEQAAREYLTEHPEWRIVYESTTQAHDHYWVTLLQKEF